MRISDWSSDVCSSDLGDDDDLRVAEVPGPVADMDGGAQGPQPLDDRALAQVRALHPVAEVQHDLGDAGHADAADADEVDGADVPRRAEGRRVGREWVRTCESRWSPNP